MLRKIRLTLAVILTTAITLVFLDITGTFQLWFGWIAKLQFLPAVLALNVAVVVALIALTLLLGRIYCSVICPLGVFQDVVAWFGKKAKRNRYSYSKGMHTLRVVFLVLFVVSMIAGFSVIPALLAPYSSYGRMVTMLFQPLYQMLNNALAAVAERMDSYAFYSVDIWLKSIPTVIVALVTLVTVSVMAWRNGRTYCNTICPVGTVLGFFSRFSRLKIVLDETKCKKCGKCARNCKSACIDFDKCKVDYSRCVVCGDCLQNCSFNAISYGHRKTIMKEIDVIKKKQDEESAPKEVVPATSKVEDSIDTGKRAFLTGAVMAAVSLGYGQEKKKVDGGYAVIEEKVMPSRNTKLVPPGALSIKNFAQHCTACQLCVSECPNGVLRPSTDLMTLMQPTMSYERGFCRPECTRCSDVCPTGAIRPISKEDKSSTKIGNAVWIKENCIILKDEVACGNCERHCPTGAITMTMVEALETDDGRIPIVPVIDEERCIGCGACEHVCPSRPYAAIYVEGREHHSTI